MIIIDKKYWTAAESDKHDWIFIHFFSIIFTMGTLKSVSPPQHSNRSTILKVSPMVTEVTFAPFHNTTHVLFCSSFVCQSWQKQHFSSSAMLSPSLVSGHSSSDRSGIGPPFLLIPDVLGPSFSMIFFSVFLLVCWIQRQH